LCRKTMLEPDALQQYNQLMDNMQHPPEQNNQEDPSVLGITIYCNDCNQQNSITFNAFMNKCPQCNSYNTFRN
jgi:Zn finger protein HypA/HybF involved in hydrogenase expression